MNRLYPLMAVMAVFCLIFMLAGCGSGDSTPVSPSTGAGYNADNPLITQQTGPQGPVDPLPVTERTSEEVRYREDRLVFGIWDIGIDPETREITVVPNRELMIHVDVTNMITPPQCNDCIGISVISVDPVTHIFYLNVSLRNPTKNITGYDVRGTLLFPEGDNRELVNADDFTTIFAGGVISSFKAFAKSEPLRRFLPGVTHYEEYHILFPPPANLHVSYVVDASWPANQEEIFDIDNVYLDGGFNECNSAEGWLYADIWDWQGNATGVDLDLAPLGGGVVPMEHVLNRTYRCYLNNEWGVGPGEYRLWFTANSEDTEYALYDFYPLQAEVCSNWPPIWDDTIGIVELVSVAGGFEVRYGTATDTDVPVTYDIYFSQDDPIEWTTTGYVNDADGSPHMLSGLTDDSTYWVGVRAVDALGAEEKNTIQMSGIPSNPPEWLVTTGITGVNPLDHAVEVLYGEAVDPQEPVTYNVYWDDGTPIDFGNPSGVVNDTGSPTIVDIPENFVEYYFAVRAVDGVGSEDQNTNELPATGNGPPEWVDTIGITSTSPGHESVMVTYGTAIDIDLPIVYNVYYSTTPGIDFGTVVPEVDTDGSPYTVTGLPNGVTHYFAVRAEDSTGVEEDNIIEIPGTPNSWPTWENDEAGVQSLIPFDHQVTVHYGHALDADMPITYLIYYSTNPINFVTGVPITTTDESPYVVDSLDNYIPYFFAVRAEDALGIREQNTNELSTIPNPAPIWDDTVGVQLLEPGNMQIIAYYGTASDIDLPVSYRVYYTNGPSIDFDTDIPIEDTGGSPTLIPGLINGVEYTVAVRAVDAYGHEDQNTVTLKATPAGVPMEVWSVFTGGVVQGSPALADLNGDTILDVIVGNEANEMVAYSGVDGSELWSFPTGGWCDSSPALANLGGDATPDVIFGSLDHNVYCVDGATGLEIWHATTGHGIVSSPTLANIKGDFHLDVIVGSFDGSVYAFNGADGSQEWAFPTGAGIFSSPANADLTGDEIPDIVVGSRDGNVYAINGITGGQIWSYAINEWVNSSPALTDLNFDTIPDAIVAGLDGDVHAINGATGLNIWTFPTGSYIWTSPALGYINGDVVADVVLGADSSSVYAIDGATGTELWQFPSMDRIWSSAALIDLTDDGTPDAVVGSDDRYLYGIDGTDGSILFAYPTGDWIDSSPAVGDVDGDGMPDIAFGRYDGYVSLVEADYTSFGATPWPMFRRNWEHTAAF